MGQIQELLHVVCNYSLTKDSGMQAQAYFQCRNTDYHLRRSKFIVYQLAMICCVVSESLGTAALSDYLKQQDYVEKNHPGGAEYNNDYIGIASYNIFSGIYVAFVFGGAFFFDLFFPERREDRGIRIAWRCCAVFATISTLADVIALTVFTSLCTLIHAPRIILTSKQIIVSSHSARVTGVNDPAEVNALLSHVSGTPLEYRRNGRALSSLVFLWLGLPFVFASTVILFFSLRHDESQGPLSSHAQQRREETRRDVETAGGTFQLPSNRNIDGYHDHEKESEDEEGIHNGTAPVQDNGPRMPINNDPHISG